VVGAKLPSEGIVFPEFNELNPDSKHPIYSSEVGMYKKKCGITNLKFGNNFIENCFSHMINVFCLLLMCISCSIKCF